MNDLLPKFLLKLVRPKEDESAGDGRMIIIIRRPYAQLAAELTAAFKGQPDAKVIVDRRETDRRSQLLPVDVDRRRSDRRRQTEQMLDVVISA
jgi:hypothetical protein